MVPYDHLNLNLKEGTAGSIFAPHSCALNKKCLFFQDEQMVLLPFFEIPYGDRLAKNVKKRYVQVIPRSTTSVSSQSHTTVPIIQF